MDERKLYRLCADEFAARVRRIGDRWDTPTPCAGWDVRALVRHVVEEELWAPPLLAGATIADVGDRFAGDQLGDDPLGAFKRAHAAALTAVDEAPDRDVHLSFGDTPRAEYTLQLAADHLVHAWDLARAVGEDDTLDAGAVEAVREWFGSMEDAYRGAGVIGDRVPVDPGADPQTALLAMFGRARGGDALAAVERFDRAFGARDVDAVMAAMTPDCVFEDTSPPGGRRHVGAAAVRAAWEALFAASPDATFTTEEIVEAGDRVVARWRYDYGDGHVRGVDLFTVRDGRVAEKLSYVKG
jgi:uncharacterized protein (TIGR03086 family)